MAQRAAALAKADLASATVMEMTALAGTMGRHYAQKEVRVFLSLVQSWVDNYWGCAQDVTHVLCVC